MSFEMQVKVDKIEDGKPVSKFVSVQATDAKEPYRYKTKREAEWSLNICYPMPLEGHLKRVIEVDAPANMD